MHDTPCTRGFRIHDVVCVVYKCICFHPIVLSCRISFIALIPFPAEDERCLALQCIGNCSDGSCTPPRLSELPSRLDISAAEDTRQATRGTEMTSRGSYIRARVSASGGKRRIMLALHSFGQRRRRREARRRGLCHSVSL